MEKKEAIKEINQAIRDGLNQWADIALEAEDKQWAVDLNYFPRDLMNATYLFQHVASNIGIKNGIITEANTEAFSTRLRQLIIDMTGYDPHQFFNEKQSDEHGKEQETSPVSDGKLS